MASIAKRPDGQWRARYRDAAGKEHAKHFRRRTDAQQWLDQETTKQQTNTWVAPRAAKVTVEDWCTRWLDGYRTRKPSTVRMAECTLPRSLRRSALVGWTRSDLPRSKAGWCNCKPSMRRATSTRCTPDSPRCLLMPSTMACWPAIRARGVRHHARAVSGLTWPPQSRSGRSATPWTSATERACCWHPSRV
jgi:hypothetical protein